MPVQFVPHLPNIRKLMTKPIPAVQREPNDVWWRKDVLQKIQLTGHRTVGFHIQKIEGDTEAYNSLNNYGQGSARFSDVGQAGLTGNKVLGVFNFDFKFTNNRFSDPQSQRTSINYAKGPWTADIGDIQGTLLNTNSFASFSKSLKGVMAGYRRGPLSLKGVRSNVRASARTASIQGNGGPGPYYLNSTQLIQDSEEVRVDGVTQKLGTDYTIDYQIGSITFVSKQIPQTSTLTVSYETLGVNSNTGTIQGIGAAYDLGKYGRLGYTKIEQLTGGNVGLGSRSDLFQGFGAPETPYTLSFSPLTGSNLIVKLDGQIQTENVDYRRDTGNNSIFYFLRFVPSTSTIEVIYTPQPTQTVSGDRRVSGWDYSLPLKAGRLTYSEATGSRFNTVTPSSGRSQGIDLNLNLNGWLLNAGAHKIPAEFVGIESRGFQRNDRSVTWSASKSDGPYRYGFNTANSYIANLSSTSTTTYGRSTRTNAFTEYRVDETRYGLGQTRTTSNGVSSDSQLDITSLNADRRFGKLELGWNLQRQAGTGFANAATKSLISYLSGVTASYAPSDEWTTSTKFSLSQTKANEESGRGTDFQFSVNYIAPTGAVTSSLSFLSSRSGSLAALNNFNNGSGQGYDTSGFNSGNGDLSSSNAATDLQNLSWISSFRLGKRARLDNHLSFAETSGSVSSNTRSTSYGSSIQLQIGKSHSLNLGATRSITKYLDGSTSSEAITMDGGLSGAFGTKWNYRLGSNYLISSGGLYAQNRVNFDGNLTRMISALDSLGLNFQTGQSLGYQPQNDSAFGLSYGRFITRGLVLSATYRWKKLTYADQATSGYRSSGLDIELNADFGR